MRTTWLFSIWPDLGSNNLPARTAVVSGACACDQTKGAVRRMPNAASVILKLDLRFIADLPKFSAFGIQFRTELIAASFAEPPLL
jgi:hypothetical protein